MRDPLVTKTTGMIGKNLEDLSATYKALGTQLRTQVSKKILVTSKNWGSIAFLFKDISDELKAMFATFKTDGSSYKRQTYFIVKSREEAKEIISLLKEWFNIK